MTDRGIRTLRGVVAAAASTLVAAMSHSIADGRMAGLFAVSVAFTASVFVCIALAGRRLSNRRLAVAVGLSQLAYHGMFAWAPSGDVTASGAAGPHAAHLAGSLQLSARTVAHEHGAVMWLAHLIAAALTFAALSRGERSVRALFAALSLALSRLLVVPAPVSVSLPPLGLPDAVRLRPAGRAPSPRTLRGPPVLALG